MKKSAIDCYSLDRANPTFLRGLFLLLIFPILTACNDEDIYTLYRSSTFDNNDKITRIHVATFDASSKSANGTIGDYNQGNCRIAMELFQNQDGVKVKYWCEKGRYKK